VNLILLFLVLLGAVGVTAIAQRKGLQPALIIVVVGFAVSFIPGLPRLEVDSEVILGAVLPPLLFSAALNFSFFSFVRNLRPIIGLGVGLVVVTAIVVGLVASWLVPTLSFGAAVLLGAIVAPPDAVTAVAIGRKLGLPKRVMAILTGESLVNDAAALTIFSITVATVAGTHTLFENPVLLFLYAALVGSLIGIVLGFITNFLRKFLKSSGLETVLGLMLPFAAYFIAEQVEASGVLAVVMAGFAVGTNSSKVCYETRLQERQVWNSLDVVLEAFVFAYMGLQLRFVISDVIDAQLSAPLVFAAGGIVLVVVLLVRPAWVFTMFGRGLLRQKGAQRRKQQVPTYRSAIDRRNDSRRAKGMPLMPERQPLDFKENVVVSWTGMRGVVTIAAAAGIPLATASGAAFPGRAVIQAIAFTVAVGTLLIQGSTLPALIRRLKLESTADDEFERAELAKATAVAQEAMRGVAQEFAANPPEGVDPSVLALIQKAVDRQLQIQETYAGSETEGELPLVLDQLLQTGLQAQRSALIRERDAGRLDDEAAMAMIERLDHQEAAVASRVANRL
jgi:NhaP-type Na+/H+ or K+/H+ antiporter